MNDRLSGDTVQSRMKGIRREIDQDIENVTESAHKMVDWKSYVASHPWACLGAAAAIGFLVSPKRSNGNHTAPVDSAPPVPYVAAKESTVTRGLFDAFMTIVVSVSVREAIGYFGPRVEALLAGEGRGRNDDEPA